MRAPITDPRRLLGIAPLSAVIPSWLRCYCLGCDSQAFIGRIHKVYGRVDCCPAHDPERTAYALAFGQPAGTNVVPPAVPVPSVNSDDDRGRKTPLLPKPFSRPPSGQKAEIAF